MSPLTQRCEWKHWAEYNMNMGQAVTSRAEVGIETFGLYDDPELEIVTSHAEVGIETFLIVCHQSQLCHLSRRGVNGNRRPI